MEKREFVMLAHPYDRLKHNINGSYMSEKLDGQRALWLPWTRGDRVSDIPFANRERDSRDHVATGLWSRYGKPIFAPDWWLDKLPPDELLDGELYLGRGLFQTLSSYVRKHPAQRKDSEWRDVRYCLFDVPDVAEFLRDGRIYTPNYKTVFDGLLPRESVVRDSFLETLGVRRHNFRDFDQMLSYLSGYNFGNEPVTVIHHQRSLPYNTDKAFAELDDKFGEIIGSGGEGIILRKHASVWTPKRTTDLLKVKPTQDDEALIIGFTLGIGKLDGLLGALVLSWKGKTFELSGFTDAERQLFDFSMWNSLYQRKERIFPEPGVKFSPLFNVGDRITFNYRELTQAGIPKEGRYFRKRHWDE